MREIKMRAWDKKLNVMWQGIELEKLLSYLIFQQFPNADAYRALKDHFKDIVWLDFTGINDKNIKEVYDGDIVDVHDTTIGTEDIVRGEVYWCDSYLCWSIQWLPKQSGADSMRLVKKSLKRSNETPSSELGDRRWPMIEVVGNKYETPELLK